MDCKRGIVQILTCDAENLLTQVISGIETITYSYNGDGDLVWKETPAGITVYSGPHFELFVPADPPDPSGPPLIPPTTYTYFMPIATGGGQFTFDGQIGVTTKYYFLGSTRVAQREGRAGPITYLYHDHLGSTVASSERRSSACA